MLSIKKNSSVYIAVGVTDMRKSINGLSLLARKSLTSTSFPVAFSLSVTVGRILLKSFIGQKTDFASG